MHVEAGVALQPTGDCGMLMGGIVVGDDVDGKIGRGFPINDFEKGEPLLMPMAHCQAADQPALEVVERRKQRQRAVSQVIMGLGANVSDPQRQTRLGAFQRLAL